MNRAPTEWIIAEAELPVKRSLREGSDELDSASTRMKRGESHGRQRAETSAYRMRRKPARRRETARSERDRGLGSPRPRG